MFQNQSLTRGDRVNLTKNIPPWLFRAVVDVPVILRQQVDVMEDRTGPVAVGHRLLEARFKEQRRINFQAGFTN